MGEGDGDREEKMEESRETGSRANKEATLCKVRVPAAKCQRQKPKARYITRTPPETLQPELTP